MRNGESVASSQFSPLGAVGPDRLPLEVVDLLKLALRRGATDVLLAVDRPPSFRVSATLTPAEELPPPGPDAIVLVAHTLLGEGGIAELERHRDRDFAFEVTGLARFRGSFYYQRGGLALALRVLPASIPSLDELGLPSVVAQLASLSRGLILVTGPTGSGKSTALAAIIDLINVTHAKHIVTIEDPVEFVHADKLSRVEQREVGRDTPSFSRALRSVVRQSPDVVLVGEMRDVETIQTVLSLAETGHLTLATLHTSSCANTIHRIIDVFAEDRQAQIRAQLALSLEAVLSLALLPRIGGGLALATEVMMGTAAIRAMIRDGRAHQIYGAIQAGQQASMRTMNHSLAALVKRRHVTLEDAEARSPDVKELRQLLSP
ncbi:MAG: PilT/PilU family type 4a pilus ATPase [Deltaproteobacteria bacterium]|nr:MAG: PilT/PilU family type 4a pilus ATPase [Deltaproteobacteria bacterium]